MNLNFLSNNYFRFFTGGIHLGMTLAIIISFFSHPYVLIGIILFNGFIFYQNMKGMYHLLLEEPEETWLETKQ